MKKLLMVLTALFCLGAFLLPPDTAEAYWGYRRYKRYNHQKFRPRFSLSFSGGLHFVDVYGSSRGRITSEDYSFAFAVFEAAGHLWIHPNLSLDLALGTHILTKDGTGDSFAYGTVKPGVRLKLGRLLYLRGAFDLAFSGENARHKVLMYGFLVGIGIRAKISRYTRFFAELDYQMRFSADRPYIMPFYGQIGFEVMF